MTEATTPTPPSRFNLDGTLTLLQRLGSVIGQGSYGLGSNGTFQLPATYIGVDNCDARVEKVKELGGTLVHGTALRGP